MPPVGPARRARRRRGGRPPSRSRRTTCAAPHVSSRHELPGAHQPYTAVLEARPSIRTGTQDSGRGRTISKKRSRRWEPTAFPRRSHPASSALALPSLTYKGADLTWAHLEGASLIDVHLKGAYLSRAYLEGARFTGAHLKGAYLTGAELDGKTLLADAYILEPDDKRPLLARLLRRPRYGPALGDIHWGDFDLVQLTQLAGWEDLRRLADERYLSWRIEADYHRDAVRAYRQVAQRLRDQGFSDIADRLSNRAQV